MFDLSEKRGSSLFFILAIPTLFISQYLSLKFNQRVKEDFSWVTHTFEVNDQLQSMETNVLDIQNGLRGYIITEQPAQKSIMEDAFADLEKHWNEALKLTRDNSQQQKRLESLQELIAKRKKHALSLIQIRDSKGFSAARDVIVSGEGSVLTANILSKLKEMEASENLLLSQREAQANHSANSSSLTVIFGSFFSTLLLIFAAIFVRRDLKARALANDQLSLSEQKFRHTFAYSPIGVAMANLNGEWEEVNATFCHMLGFKPEELIGHHFNEITHPDDLEIGLQQVQRIRSGNQTTAIYEKRYFKKSGQELTCLVHLTVLKDALGKSLRYMGEFLDISDRKKAEEALRVEKEFNESITALVPNSIYIYDLSTRTYVYTNQEFESYLGYSREQIKALGDQFVFEVLHPDDLKLLAHHFRSRDITHQGNGLVEHTIRVKCADGEYKWVLSRLAIFRRDEKEMPLQLIGVFQDISELKLKEELLGQAVKTKSEFLANMSHEIRTPLNGIMATTDILIDTGLNPEQTRYARIVQASGLSLLTIINDILDFSKIEAGKFVMDSIPFSLASVIEGQLELLLGKAREKKLTLASYIDPKLPLKLLGDPGRVGQVLLNLIGNAIKFTENGGVIIRAFEEGASKSLGRIRIKVEVEDTGIGVTDAVAKKLFQPFTQADGSTSRKYGGTGLGLSISKKLIEYMDGEIGVTENPQGGSVFWFTAELALPTPTVYLQEFEYLVNLRVLICDSDSLALSPLQTYLNAWKMRGETAAQAESALSILTQAQTQKDPFRILLIEKKQMSLRAPEFQQLALSQVPALQIILIDDDFRDRVAPESSSRILKPIKQSTLLDSMMTALGEKTVFESMGISQKRNAVTSLSRDEQLANRSFKILLAEDNGVNQIIALKILDTLGYAAQAVANGKEAVEALHQHHYDLVLMDCQMPEMDGYEASQQIRESSDSRIKNLPIIALTANAMKGDKEKCLEAGMSDYVTKPIRKESLAEKLELWLKRTT